MVCNTSYRLDRGSH